VTARMVARVRFAALIARLFRHITPRRRLHFVFLTVLTIAGSIAEAASLGAVVPFIGILTDPARVFAQPTLQPAIRWLGATSAGQLITPLALLFAVTAFVAGGVRLLLLWVSTVVSNATGADLSVAVYRRVLDQPYGVHVARNSSEVISGMTQKAATAALVLMSLVTFATSIVLFGAILLTLLLIDPLMAATSSAVLGGAYAVVAVQTRRRLRENSAVIAQAQTTTLRALQEGLGAIRDVLLHGTQDVYVGIYEKSIRQLQRATGENSYITIAPRFGMETLGMMLVALVALVLARQGTGMASALPVLAALGLGAQRLLPLLQQCYGNWSVIVGNQAALADVLDLLEQPVRAEDAGAITPGLAFRDRIVLRSVRLRYDLTGPFVLENISLQIPRGARIGIIGTTGSGKSSLLDVLMSLLNPTDGGILVDGVEVTHGNRRAWQRMLAHVPQAIFLTDASVAENIAFGVPPERIDSSRVRESAVSAQIDQFVQSLPQGYETSVGERGVRLSGGQRQRIGIARALYKQASVLILDEATSALDAVTEAAVISELSTLTRELTIVSVAHRISTLRHCDTIIQIENGRIVAQGPFAEFDQGAAAVPLLGTH
jgi:ABC-type multidrug transport system fused ATPase/permease subunit